MIQRCRDPNPRFASWFGRGITVCAEWQDYATFRAWAVANGYRKHLTIDRINNDGNYEPSNCRWATYAEQGCNKRNNRKIGDRLAAHVAAQNGIPRSTLYHRLHRGWPLEKAVQRRARNEPSC